MALPGALLIFSALFTQCQNIDLRLLIAFNFKFLLYNSIILYNLLKVNNTNNP